MKIDPLISLWTKEALVSKISQSIQLGEPKGTIQKSKLDKDILNISEALS